jgi:hypothetical protein
MAKIEFIMDDFGEKLEQLAARETLAKIVEAGSAAAVKVLQGRTESHHHVVTGQMKAGVKAGKLYEDLNSAWQYVYPQGTNSEGKDLAKIAHVINYGYGGRKTAKTGDKFLTGKKPELEEAVQTAMMAEADRIKNEIMR